MPNNLIGYYRVQSRLTETRYKSAIIQTAEAEKILVVAVIHKTTGKKKNVYTPYDQQFEQNTISSDCLSQNMQHRRTSSAILFHLDSSDITGR